VRETEAIIGKAPRLGIHTSKCHAAVRPCGSLPERNTSGTQLNKISGTPCGECGSKVGVWRCEVEGARGGCVYEEVGCGWVGSKSNVS